MKENHENNHFCSRSIIPNFADELLNYEYARQVTVRHGNNLPQTSC